MSQSADGRSGGPRNVLDKAWQDLATYDLIETAGRAGGEMDSEGGLAIAFLGKRYSVLPALRIVQRADQKKVNPFLASLVLHYLIGAKSVEPSGRLLTFRELEGGNVYYDAFYRRAILPLAQELGDRPEMLAERASRVGGTSMSLGDSSVRIPVFPRLPVIVVVWQGDDEVPSSANILFDSTAGLHLHTEDLAAVGDLTADVLILSDDEWRGW